MNRGNAKGTLFQTEGDYRAFEKAMGEGKRLTQMRILCYCLMPNHWHMILWPRLDNDLSKFAGWVTLTHTQRFHSFHETTGSGHVYQGRFKSVPVQGDGHFFTACRYVEGNALRARLVASAEDWQWGSLWLRFRSKIPPWLVDDWPVEIPPDWVESVNSACDSDFEGIRQSVARGVPYGSRDWLRETFGILDGLAAKPPGRPKSSKPARTWPPAAPGT